MLARSAIDSVSNSNYTRSVIAKRSRARPTTLIGVIESPPRPTRLSERLVL